MKDDMSVKDHIELAQNNKKFPLEVKILETGIEANKATVSLAKENIKYFRWNIIFFVVNAVLLALQIFS